MAGVLFCETGTNGAECHFPDLAKSDIQLMEPVLPVLIALGLR
jgi:hypothetical protein